MDKKILIDAVYPGETRVAILENNKITEFDYETSAKKLIKGNIYLAKITRVEASLQAAFIDYGGDKNGFLPFSEIHPDYYQIPTNDRPEAKKVKTDIQSNKDLDQSIKEIVLPQNGDDSELEVETLATELPGKKNLLFENLAHDNIAENQSIIQSISVDDEHSLDEIADELEVVRSVNTKYKIQEVIKKNQIILIQIIKEERGNKGASCTSYISLAGRYCVLMPNNDKQGGVSRKISNADDRKRLKSIIEDLSLPKEVSMIIRTAGAFRTKSEIKKDYDYLVKLWNSIRERTLSSSAPAFIHAEGDVIKRTIRDLFDNKTSEIIVQGQESFNSAKDFMYKILPQNVNKVKNYRSKTPIFCKYKVEEQIAGLYSQIVKLSSGGYIVMNITEAMIAIDVNSGSSTSERNIEETATKTNLEAANEIARQLRLKDLSGLIVIDFIDMTEAANRKNVERSFKEALQFDKAKIQVGLISLFGLLEMSRQRLRPSFLEANTLACTHCNGKGYVRASEPNAIMILRTLESEIFQGDYSQINVYANSEVIIYILNNKKESIFELEKRYNTSIIFHAEAINSLDSFSIEKIKRSKRIIEDKETVNDKDSPLPLPNNKGLNLNKIEEKSVDVSIDDLENKKLESVEVTEIETNNFKKSKKHFNKNYRSKQNKNFNHNRNHNTVQGDGEYNKKDDYTGNKKGTLVKKSFKPNQNKNKSVEKSKPSVLKGLWKKIIE